MWPHLGLLIWSLLFFARIGFAICRIPAVTTTDVSTLHTWGSQGGMYNCANSKERGLTGARNKASLQALHREIPYPLPTPSPPCVYSVINARATQCILSRRSSVGAFVEIRSSCTFDKQTRNLRTHKGFWRQKWARKRKVDWLQSPSSQCMPTLRFVLFGGTGSDPGSIFLRWVADVGGRYKTSGTAVSLAVPFLRNMLQYCTIFIYRTPENDVVWALPHGFSRCESDVDGVTTAFFSHWCSSNEGVPIGRLIRLLFCGVRDRVGFAHIATSSVSWSE